MTKTQPAKSGRKTQTDACAIKYDGLDDHGRHEILSALGTSVIDQPRNAARLRFADLPSTVQEAVRSVLQD